MTPLIALSLTSLIGLAVTPVLLKGYFGFPALGIVAPAIATILGYAAVLIFLGFYLNYKNHPLKIDARLLQSIRHDATISKLILKLGIPTGVQMVTTLGMNVIFTGSLITLAYLFSKYLMALFITDHSVIELGQQLLFIVLWAVLFFGASAIFASIMRASGTVNVPMMINILTIILIEVPCAYWFSSLWGLTGIWTAYALSFVCLCVLQASYYQFVWKKTKIKVLI